MSALTSAELPTARELYDKTAHVIGQEDARMALAVLLRRQLQVAQGGLDAAHGALAAGRTGVGKSLLISSMCRQCGLPFAEVNATQYTDKGYVGLDLSQMFVSLVEAAVRLKRAEFEAKYGEGILDDVLDAPTGGSVLHLDARILDPAVEAAECGVILLDEFDKWMLQTNDLQGRNVGQKLQAELLKMVEGGEVYISDDEEEMGRAFDTRRVLIIAAGAFVGLEKIVTRRLKTDLEDDPKAWDRVQPEDFVRYGLLPELAGRLTSHVMFRPLTPENLTMILMEEGGLLDEYQRRAEAEGMTLRVEEAGARSVAAIALSRKTGARGLRHILEKVFYKPLFVGQPGQTIVLDVEAAGRLEGRLA